MIKAVSAVLLFCLVATGLAATDAHRLSYRGIRPQADALTTGPFKDGDGHTYYCDSWKNQSNHLIWVGYRYTQPEYYWRDQKYLLGADASDMMNPEVGLVNSGAIYEIGGRKGLWVDGTHNFSDGSDSQTIEDWDHSYNADPIGYTVTFLSPPYSGDPPGVYLMGLKALNSNGTTRLEYLGYAFWQLNATGGGNVYKSGSTPQNPGGTTGDGGDDGADDPNGTNNGWGSILSLDWWKKLFVFLFVPTQEDLEVIKESITQFQNWGIFKVIADIAEQFGDMAGGSMGDLSTDFIIPIPAFTMWGGTAINTQIDLSPFAVWLLIARAVMLGWIMIRVGNWWLPKYQAILGRS